MIYDIEDMNTYMLKTAAGILRKRALDLYTLEDDSELRESFETVGGIETGIEFCYIIKWPSRCLDTVN